MSSEEIELSLVSLIVPIRNYSGILLRGIGKKVGRKWQEESSETARLESAV